MSIAPRLAAGVVLGAAAATAGAGINNSEAEAVGLNALLDRVGIDNLPTGAGILVGQVEAPDAQGDYGPDTANAEFAGKLFLPMDGATGPSTHATNVGKNYYGLVTSIAPGVDSILNWDVTMWAAGSFLHTNQGVPPAVTPGDLVVFNNSWIGTFGTAASDNNAVRRADFVMSADNVLMVSAVDNDESSVPDDGQNLALLGHAYNGLTVGVSDGSHTTADSLAIIDGPGRQLPQLVAPGNKVSWAAPVISAAVALMVQTARETPSLAVDPAAQRGEVIKAVLMAGTDHRAAWTNHAPASGPDRGATVTPLDDVYGADEINVNTSHLALTRGRRPGQAAPPPDPVPHAGWDLAAVDVGESRWWRFRVCENADTLSVIATWHRFTQFPFGNADWATADFTLELWRIDEAGGPATLVGDPGLPYFGGGNVRSSSGVDNVEHLFVTGLAPGQYALELRRVDNLAAHPGWETAVAWSMPRTGPAADLDGNCAVGVTDFLELLASWGPCPDPCPVEPCPADLNGDCAVDTVDFLALLAEWG